MKEIIGGGSRTSEMEDLELNVMSAPHLGWCNGCTWGM